jgi:hypothetical protein
LRRGPENQDLIEENERLSSSLWVLGGGLWERNSGEPSDYDE